MAEIRVDGLLRAVLKTAEKQRRYDSPEARAARSARSAKAAATVRERREAEEAREEYLLSRQPVGPACGAMDIVMDAQEVFCVRPPHRAGNHEDEDGHNWSVLEEEFEDMLKVTTADLRSLLDSEDDRRVLYVVRDEDTREPVRLELWAEAHARHQDIVVRQEELVDALGGPDHPDGVTEDALEHLLEGYQETVDEIVAPEPDGPDGVYDGEVR